MGDSSGLCHWRGRLVTSVIEFEINVDHPAGVQVASVSQVVTSVSQLSIIGDHLPGVPRSGGHQH